MASKCCECAGIYLVRISTKRCDILHRKFRSIDVKWSDVTRMESTTTFWVWFFILSGCTMKNHIYINCAGGTPAHPHKLFTADSSEEFSTTTFTITQHMFPNTCCWRSSFTSLVSLAHSFRSYVFPQFFLLAAFPVPKATQITMSRPQHSTSTSGWQNSIFYFVTPQRPMRNKFENKDQRICF